MSEKLLPCPFCGKPPSVSLNEEHNGRLYCPCINDDGTIGPKTWNRREYTRAVALLALAIATGEMTGRNRALTGTERQAIVDIAIAETEGE